MVEPNKTQSNFSYAFELDVMISMFYSQELSLQMERMTETSQKKKKDLDSEMTETLTAQVCLDSFICAQYIFEKLCYRDYLLVIICAPKYCGKNNLL